MLKFFGRQRERGKQLHHYFDDYLVHFRRRRDPRIYLETIDKVFDRFEQVDECVTAGYDALCRLVLLDVTWISTYK
jgi:hypothetical protein